MDILGRARKVERRLARSVDAAMGELLGRSPRTAIEIVHAAVDLAEQRIQEAGRGRRVFPFNRIVLTVVADPADREARARISAVVEGPPSLTERIVERLQALGCRPENLSSQIVFVPGAAADWPHPEFQIAFDRVAVRAAPVGTVRAEPLRLKLAVVAGEAPRRAFVFEGERVDIGRGREVVDARQRVVRTNHIAFAEEGEASRTVSRRHAHVLYVEDPPEYRLCDDRSAHGTAIARGGRTVPVPPGPRGVRLQHGDEILLGRGRLRVTIEPLAAAAAAPGHRRSR